MARRDWDQEEVELVVADYLTMLQAEASGEPYSKTEHRRKLLPQLDDRTEASIEFKHQNVSAVLTDLGLPTIAGYKPASNYQGALRDEVQRRLALDPSLLDALRSRSPGTVVDGPEIVDRPAGDTRQFSARVIDYGLLHEEQQRIGRQGEELVLGLERQRLDDAGRNDLAMQVEWVSAHQGDGAGYDIRSFRTSGEVLHIEVKSTTQQDALSPMYFSANELAFARQHPESYEVHRVYDLDAAPKVFRITGAIGDELDLQPISFRARLKQA